MAATLTIHHLRRHTIARSLFPPTTLKRALDRLGYVQADPIRAPARAQDLTLRHRVRNYRAGDLERSYAKLGIEEDFFIAYGFVTRSVEALMHPRRHKPWPAARTRQAQALLEFVTDRGSAHPREVDLHFAHGSVTNYWGGQSNATTHLLDNMHYRGMLRVVRRENGIRIYAVHSHGSEPADAAERRARIDALVDVAVGIYAPLPAASLQRLIRRLRYAVPQWQSELTSAIQRARQRLSQARIDGLDWYWPVGEDPASAAPRDGVALLTPFDPVVWDRLRFELLWNWQYRFEAYTPAPKRKLGYYALPMLWRDRVIGWANLSMNQEGLQTNLGYIAQNPPRTRVFQNELEAELNRMQTFLNQD